MEFKKISETEILAEVPEGASVLGIVDGAVKQLPTDGMGGGKTLIIKQDNYDNVFSSGVAPTAEGDSDTATANMSLEEAMLALENCELQSVAVYSLMEGAAGILYGCAVNATPMFGLTCLCISYYNGYDNSYFYWTSDGISTEQPSGGSPE